MRCFDYWQKFNLANDNWTKSLGCVNVFGNRDQNKHRERAKCICQGIACNLSFYLGLTSAEIEKLEYYNGTAHFKNVNYCLNTNIYSYLKDIWWSKLWPTFKCYSFFQHKS